MIKTKPTVKLSGGNKDWTLAATASVDFTAETDGAYSSDCGLTVREKLFEFGYASRVEYTVRNDSENEIGLEHVSSGRFDFGGGLMPWYDERKYKVYVCYFTWQGEAQWKKYSLADLGLYHASNHRDVNAIRLRSVGNQSTACYYPQIFIEDAELNKMYFFEIEASGNWYIEIGGNNDGALRAELNSAFFNNDNWHFELKSGEEYTASPCVFGEVDGGFEEAVAALTDFRRASAKAKLKSPPVCFNDYMNCLWAMPETHKLIPLIDKAAEVGCEVFCIDDGWQKKLNQEISCMGDWNPRDERFPGYGFEGIIKYIADKGMLPGAWLELNSVAETSEAFGNLSGCFLMRNGGYVGSAGNCQFDFRKKETCDYVTGVFDKLYGLGVRYIKNDFNQTSGIGVDGEYGVGEQLRQNSLAFDKLIDDIRAKYPDLIIENCASGSMRTDGSIMKHFHLVSVSDQEYYYNNPSILSGSAACVQPEKCGSWAYPYPQLFDDRMLAPEECMKPDYDKKETIFNMINGMLGIMYLSGHIELADGENTGLIKEAVELYKKNRDFIANAYPIYPSGIIPIEKNGFYSYGLQKDGKILLAVWRINSEENTAAFDLSKYTGGRGSARVIYPIEEQTEFLYVNGKLSVKLDGKYEARLFEISKQ